MPYHTSMGRTSCTETWNLRTSWQNRAKAARSNWKSVILEWPSSWTRRLATCITPGIGLGPLSTWPRKFWEVEARGTLFPPISGRLGPWWHSWRGENQIHFPELKYSDKKDYHKIIHSMFSVRQEWRGHVPIPGCCPPEKKGWQDISRDGSVQPPSWTTLWQYDGSGSCMETHSRGYLQWVTQAWGSFSILVHYAVTSIKRYCS